VIFKALACDFDGTVASEDRIHPAALEALRLAREAEVRLVLVTGRTFFELTRVCECLDLFDAVVAENGAVLYFPADAMIRDQGPPPPNRLLAELDRRGIYYQPGRVIVGTARADEAAVQAALGAAGVRRDLVYNRAALMLLPAGVSKGKGVERALRALGLSFHDVLAFGDAENDLDLFEACDWTACPSNGVAELKARADWVFPGQDGDAVAAAIAGPVLGGNLPVRRSPRHRVPVGWVTETSEPVTVPARDANLLLQGDPLSGKSWMAGALVERLVGDRYAVCVIDPEGDYRVFASQSGVTWMEIHDQASVRQAITHFARDPGACVVADLSLLPHALKVRLIEAMLQAIRHARQQSGRPHWVILDEAHYSLHPGGVADHALGIADKGFCLATYRSSWLRDSVLASVDVFVLARTAMAEELGFLRSRLAPLLGGDAAVLAALGDLPSGEFLVIEPEGGPGGLTIVAAPRETVHVRHLKKYADSRVPSDRRFLFRHPDGRLFAEADSLQAFRRAVAAAEEDVLAHHVGRGDFSRWVLGVFSDRELARQLRKTEARWRRGEIREIRRTIERLIGFRYGPEG
jgi:hypothetical protein